MSRSGKRGWPTLGCAALLGASIAFPAGLFLGADRTPRDLARQPRLAPAPSGETRTARNPFSPRIGTDPYVMGEQRKVLRALEQSCTQLKRHCPEAREARLRIEEVESRQ